MLTTKSHSLRTTGDIPAPSAPITTARSLAAKSAAVYSSVASAAVPTIQTPAFFSARSAPATFATRAIGMCAVAPADALRTVALTPAARRSGSTTAVAPAHSAVRMMAPALCGSVMWSNTTNSARCPGRRKPTASSSET